MKAEQSGKIFEHFAGDKYKVTVYHGSNVMEIEELVELSWWKKIFSTQERVWKRMYFGHVTPLEEFTKFYHEVVVR